MNQLQTRSLGDLLEAFFLQYLIAQRSVSPHTVAAYRDTMRLLLTYASAQLGRLVCKLVLQDLDRDFVLAFLDHLERDRKNSVSTRNARLAAIRSFFRYVAAAEPAALGMAQRILSIPAKRTTKRLLGYLDQEDLQSILDAPDLTTPLGRRDRALILFLARTGARVSEACDVNAADLKLDASGHVLLRGKGSKQRAVPLTKDIARVLEALCEERGLTTHSQAPLFVNSRGQRLTRWGVTHLLKRAVAAATKTTPGLEAKHISPHTLRHYLPFRTMSRSVGIFADRTQNSGSRR